VPKFILNNKQTINGILFIFCFFRFTHKNICLFIYHCVVCIILSRCDRPSYNNTALRMLYIIHGHVLTELRITTLLFAVSLFVVVKISFSQPSSTTSRRNNMRLCSGIGWVIQIGCYFFVAVVYICYTLLSYIIVYITYDVDVLECVCVCVFVCTINIAARHADLLCAMHRAKEQTVKENVKHTPAYIAYIR
jgi:hypothetical protein